MASPRSTTSRTPSSKPERTAGRQGGVLTQAVAGTRRRLDADPLDGVEDDQAQDEGRQLGVGGQGELVLVGLEQEPAQVAPGHARGLGHDFPRRVVDPFGAHAGSL